MKSEHLDEIKGILILAIALILFASFISYDPLDLPWYTNTPNAPAHNLVRIFGAYTAGSLFFMFGYGCYFLVIFLFFWAWNIFTSRTMVFTSWRLASLGVLVTVMSGLFAMGGVAERAARFDRGGITGLLISDFLVQYFGVFGAYVLLIALACLCMVIAGEFLVSPLIVRATRGTIDLIEAIKDKQFKAWFTEVMKPKPRPKPVAAEKERPKKAAKAYDEDEVEEDDVSDPVEDKKAKKEAAKLAAAEAKKLAKAKEEEEAVKAEPPPPPPKPVNIRILQQAKQEAPKEREDKPLVVGNYQLPPFELLNDPPEFKDANVQEKLVSGAKTLEQTLQSFGVTVRVVDIERGPVITKYELEPAPGVRVGSINSLSGDIALAMQAPSIRIQAPIPGKNRVGIEVPNGASAAVVLKDVLQSGNIRNSKHKLTLALGKDTSGKPIVANLADMPHLLVAGSTGSGKTVALNVIITSILYNAAPNEVKFIMVDPKMVELIQYNDIPHMLCPAITDHKKVAAALGWVVAEMESRYKTLAKHKLRNISSYHAAGFEMPYIVVVVDEFADLMSTSGKVVESAVVRLAQLARAVGIHLILATQRPSVNVITGIIKANLPARLAFRVNSQVDSRTILDEKGAEDLLGKGDMLFMKPGDPKPTRGQCSYLSDDEIHKVMDFIRNQQKPQYDESVTARPAGAAGGASDEKDEIFDDAVKVVMETGQASASMLQRRLGLGFSRAGRIIDQMERAGLIGPNQGSKPREILIDREKWILDNMAKEAGAEAEPAEEKPQNE